jgi:selenide,water dikinase
MAVTGTVHPDRIATNAGARAGDVLFLSKPLGTGLISTAIKRENCEPDWEAAAIASMTSLNRSAAQAAQVLGVGRAAPVGAITDVTGFGLVGHALEMARASGVSLQLQAGSLPLLPGALELARDSQNAPGGTNRNALGAGEGEVEWRAEAWWKNLAWDPQTSGGLLIAVREESAGELERELRERGAGAARVGTVQVLGATRIVVE